MTMGPVALRLRHVDRMRAVAILCMVEVHTAAIIPPEGVTVGHPAAFVAAAFGGMAAPMFVTISGWGMYRSSIRRFEEGHAASEWFGWILPRVALLSICQFLVNLLLNVERGGRFEWHTPGVLTLLAISAIIAPILVRLSFANRAALTIAFGAVPLFMGSHSGEELTWFERVDSSDTREWLQRLFLNGTYPAFPWLFFVFLGSILHDLRDASGTRKNLIGIGLSFSTLTIVYAIIEERDWALTSGDAVLTFFPASFPFLLVSGCLVMLVMMMLEGEENSGGDPALGDKLSFLEPAGRLSLTIYVAHFAVLGAAAIMLDGARLAVFPAFAVTLGHTFVWIPIASIIEKKAPRITLENLLKSMDQSGR